MADTQVIGMSGNAPLTGTPYNGDDLTSRGIAVIVQNLENADQSTKECEKLADVLQDIGFEILTDDANSNMHSNLSRPQLEALCSKVASEDFDDQYCLLFVLLARGTNRQIKGSDGRLVELNDVVKHFTDEKCPSLVSKPRLFLVQILPPDPDPNQADAMGYMPEDEPDEQDEQFSLPPDFLVYISHQHVDPNENTLLQHLLETIVNENEKWKLQKTKWPKEVTEVKKLLKEVSTSFSQSEKGCPKIVHNSTKDIFLLRRKMDI